MTTPNQYRYAKAHLRAALDHLKLAQHYIGTPEVREGITASGLCRDAQRFVNQAHSSAVYLSSLPFGEAPPPKIGAGELSEVKCPRCGQHHRLDEFDTGDSVLVADSDSPMFGFEGTVHEWSQYGCALTYRVTFGRNRVSFEPCQLRKA